MVCGMGIRGRIISCSKFPRVCCGYSEIATLWAIMCLASTSTRCSHLELPPTCCPSAPHLSRAGRSLISFYGAAAAGVLGAISTAITMLISSQFFPADAPRLALR